MKRTDVARGGAGTVQAETMRAPRRNVDAADRERLVWPRGEAGMIQAEAG